MSLSLKMPSASGGLRTPNPYTGASSLDTIRDFRPAGPLFCGVQKILKLYYAANIPPSSLLLSRRLFFHPCLSACLLTRLLKHHYSNLYEILWVIGHSVLFCYSYFYVFTFYCICVCSCIFLRMIA